MMVDQNIKILLVEDSEITRKMEINILQSGGYEQIREAGDGIIAKQMLEGDEKFDLIISDWNMPNMDGHELLKWVRSYEPHKDIPFIMATAQSEKRQISLAKEAGVSALVPKPFSLDDLIKAFDQAFSSAENDPLNEHTDTKERVIKRLPDDRVNMKIAHIQITDHLVLGVAKYLAESGKLNQQHVNLETICMPGWNPVVNAIENGEIDGALILAPIAMDLFAYGTPIKLVLLAHKNGSIFVSSLRNSGMDTAERYKDKIFYIPHQLSIHNMLAHKYLSEYGLKPGVVGAGDSDVFFEVIPPVQMPGFLSENEEAEGYMVAEPLGTKAIAEGIAELEFLSSEAWKDHPCCVAVVREELINECPEAVQEYVDMLVEAGRYIETRPDIAAEVAVKFLDPNGKLNLSKKVFRNVLTEPAGITTDDLFPNKNDLQIVQDYMKNEMGIGLSCDLDKFCDLSFAEKACGKSTAVSKSSGDTLGQIADRVKKAKAMHKSEKIMLDKEGKYLCFSIDTLGFGIKVVQAREIIGMVPITKVPRTPDFLKGVINLRGKVTPVFSLRLALGMEKEVYTERTCIIVVEVNSESGMAQMGVIVDAVSEVININASEMEPPPSIGTELDSKFLLAMAKNGDYVRMLLDIETLVNNLIYKLENAA